MSRRLSIAAFLALVFCSQTRTRTEGPGVTWTNLVNTTATLATLQKTSGCDGCEDAGAASAQSLTSDGYVEFTVGESNTLWMAGVNHGDNDTTYSDIDFGFRFNGGGFADVLENGFYAGGDTTYAPGDVFRIAVVDGRIQYHKNGQYLMESAGTPQYPLVLDTSILSIGATIQNAIMVVSPPPPPGGGFTEKAGSPAKRARFSRDQIEGFLPAGGVKGAFAFPRPYATAGVRLTDASDCDAGTDCLWYVGYSYWRNINNHVGSADMYIFLGTDPNRGGHGPILIRYDKLSEQVQTIGPLFPPDSPYANSTGEGWYFSATRPTALYTFLVGGRQLRRYDVLSRRFDTTPAMDLAACPRKTCPTTAAYITQPHSSDDDAVHSATVQDASWQRLGCLVYRAPRFAFYPTPPGYSFDECHVDKSGRWLMLLEGRPDGSRINRVVDLARGRITTIEDADGALGHLDMGFGYAVGADNFNPMPNATILLKFPVKTPTRPISPVVHFNKRWDLVAANHIAHGNARAANPESQFACGSNASRVADMADEIVCFSLNPNRNADGSLDVLVVAQTMTDLDALGGSDYDGDGYEKIPKGNLDVTGGYFIWTTNMGGDRLDAFLVKIPVERLSASTQAGSTSTRAGSTRAGSARRR